MKLGERMDCVDFVVKGDTSRKAAKILVEKLVDVCGMKKAHKPICYGYPTNGAGGEGYTYIQPITESFIAFDAWPDFGGAYLMIRSCKTVSLNRVNQAVRALGYKVKDLHANELRLKNGL